MLKVHFLGKHFCFPFFLGGGGEPVLIHIVLFDNKLEISLPYSVPIL